MIYITKFRSNDLNPSKGKQIEFNKRVVESFFQFTENETAAWLDCRSISDERVRQQIRASFSLSPARGDYKIYQNQDGSDDLKDFFLKTLGLSAQANADDFYALKKKSAVQYELYYIPKDALFTSFFKFASGDQLLFIPNEENVPEIKNIEAYKDTLSYLSALRTKPFLLLAGISGTGKSRIVRKLAQATVTEELQKKYDKEYTGTDFENDRWKLHRPANFELIQVKPNWHNSMDVLGYLSNIPSPHYVFTPFVNFIVKAWANPDVPFFLCLDEMNLAPVEEYFAEFLSAIESRSKESGKYETDPIIKPFNEFGKVKDEKGVEFVLGDMMINDLLPDFKASDANSSLAEIVKHLKEKGLTLPENLLVIGTVNMDETTFSFSRKVLDRAMSIEMNEVDYGSFLAGSTDDGLKAMVKELEESDTSLADLLVNRHIDAREVVGDLGEEAQNVIDYLDRINRLLDGTPFKLGYRAANEALIYLQSVLDFGAGGLTEALDQFTLMKILSRIEGDETKLKITNSASDEERIVAAEINNDAATQHGDLTLLTALRYIITDTLGEYYQETVQEPEPSADEPEQDTQQEMAEEADVSETGEEAVPAPSAKKKHRLAVVKKLDSMISQLKRDHFVSFWN